MFVRQQPYHVQIDHMHLSMAIDQQHACTHINSKYPFNTICQFFNPKQNENKYSRVRIINHHFLFFVCVLCQRCKWHKLLLFDGTRCSSATHSALTLYGIITITICKCILKYGKSITEEQRTQTDSRVTKKKQKKGQFWSPMTWN